jgi:predicted MFS family arabinose efflux permease
MIGNPAIDKPLGRRFIFSLALAVFGTSMLDVLSSLFLVDLAKTFFGSSDLIYIAVVSQIITISSIVAIVSGVLNGFLSVRVRHRTLLLFGALCIAIGAVGCLWAPNLFFLQIFYPFDGIGTIIVGAMAFTLIGESLPLEKRARSIGVVTSSGIVSIAIGFAIAGYGANIGGYRSYLAWYVLPISLVALFAAFFFVPKNMQQATVAKQSLSESFKQVFLNRSAGACLIGNMFLTAAGVWSIFAATFWRKYYSLPIEVVALITVAVVLVYALGGFMGGRLIDRVGRKRFVVYNWFARGILIAAVVFMPDVYSALFISFVATLIGGFAVTGSHNLIVEQVPKSRGTMMSINGVFASIGITIGTACGGLALTQGFQILGLTLGIFAVIAAMIILFIAKEPCKPTKSSIS